VILHVVAFAGGAFGGPTTVAVGQLNELQRRGYDVRLVALGSSIDGIPATLFRPRTFVPRQGILGKCNVGLLRYLWRTVPRADVVHVHAGRDLVSLAALVICRLRRVPYVAQTHGMIMPRRAVVTRVFDVALKRLLAKARCVFVLTDVEKRGLAIVAPRARVSLLPNGIAVDAGEPRTAGNPPTVLFLARLHPRKRVDAFVDLAVELRDSGAKFVIAGPDEGGLPALRTRLAAEPVARYIGELGRGDALTAVGTADVYVLPSVAEPFPMTVLEALAAGTPVVITESCGLAAPLADRAGARVTDGSSDALAEAVKSILADWPAESAAARKTAQELFGIGSVVERLLSTYPVIRPD
jgi:glycosyltransferase involved in cell wall biosynthesis